MVSGTGQKLLRSFSEKKAPQKRRGQNGRPGSGSAGVTFERALNGLRNFRSCWCASLVSLVAPVTSFPVRTMAIGRGVRVWEDDGVKTRGARWGGLLSRQGAGACRIKLPGTRRGMLG